ncbi:O-antigen ligase family protein [Anaerotruncus massiliensis (ex Liu et al. 2021)]|uniref:O-antigen ligase family protein n=2 Tax=Anaerotruncus TaxID=244127 RepID=A0A498CQT5_9FIRM|nr:MULTISPECIES: O-antigen ligase family protein [Anaerotruncus]MBC3938846.1 O-antigen ligase family protein [Anaerotruncus massiliensis (ex Togo et al. 2019)]RLL10803.1 O-antigen ligase family protein [Anaerotruncus massiliensis (ex Liu et al. 2021)]
MRLLQSRAYLFVTFLLLYKPVCVSDLPALAAFDRAWDAARYLAVGTGLLVWLIFYRSLSKWMLALAAFCGARLLTTWSHLGSFGSTLPMIVVSTLSAAAITEMAVRTGRRAFLDGASLALGLLTAAHFATVLTFPGGMYATAAYRENYLLGYDNAALTTLLPAVCLAALRDCERGRRLSVRTAAVCACAAGAACRSWTVTSAAVTLLFLLAVLLSAAGWRPRVVNAGTALAGNALVFAGLVCFGVQERFSRFLERALHKDATLSGRAWIWERAGEAFARSPLTGVGLSEPAEARALIGATHAHNFYLDLAFTGGLVCVAAFFLLLFLCARRLWRFRKTRAGFLLTAAFGCLLLAFQMEPYRFHNFLLFTLCFFAGEFSAGEAAP